MTLPMIRSAFETLFFPKLDRMRQAKEEESPLNVLLLACGTGAEVEVLCNRYDESQMSILATDFAPGMIEETQKYVDRAGKQQMVSTKLMDAMVSSRGRATYLKQV